MKRSILRTGLVALSMLVASVALAAPAADALSSILAARQSLVTLLDTTDAAKQGALEADIAKASKSVDAAISAGLADKAAAPKFKELKDLWDAFKKTRDTEIVPSVKAGKVDAAKALAKGVQAERLGKMKEILAGLGAK
jgi:hypothetical protein